MAENSRTQEDQNLDMANDPKRKAKSKDVGWKYGFWPDLNSKDVVQCSLCGKKIHAGISRLKQHLAGNYGDVAKCPKTTTEIMREMQAALASKRSKTITLDGDDDDLEEVQREQSTAASNTFSSSGTATKRKQKEAALQFEKPQQKQPKTIDSLLKRTPKQVVDERNSKGASQTTLENRFRTKEDKERVHMYIANFFYENGLPFNAANSRSYELMIEAVGQYGPGLKPPSYHELRVPLLEKAKKQTEKLKEKHENAWKQNGCTLMSDGWTDRKGRHLINFLVNSPEGTYFMSSIDASSTSHDANMLADVLESKIEEIGAENVVQVVTDNGANYKAAGHILMQRMPTLYWTPCAAHCLDLMLEDIGKLKDFGPTITKARGITTFVYRHGRLLDAMREKTNGRDLVRPGVTRFATAFLTLQSLRKFKDDLRLLFVSEDWTKSKLSKTEAGKKVCDVVLSTAFWHVVENCIRASQPLLVVLRIVDGDERPAMAELYAAMEEAKRRIKVSLENKPIICNKVIEIVERRWESQMKTPLYGASLFLNPDKYFDIKEKDDDYASGLREDFNDVLEKMVSDVTLRSKISKQADSYDYSRDTFARDIVIKERKQKSPIDWWRAFGGRALDLSKFAKRIVGLCCSSSGCERNWSTFEFIHTKKRNRLEHKRLNDLVYVQYNRKIISRFQKRREKGKDFDPLALDEFDWGNEWISNDGNIVHPGEDLTWDDVDRATGASLANEGRNLPRRARELATYSRQRTHKRGSTSSSRLIDSDEDEEIIEEEIFPNDDEDVEDDYGERPPTPMNESSAHGGHGDDEFDDLF